MSENKESRTEPATPRKRREARDKGQVAKSAEIGSAAILLSALAILYVIGPSAWQGLRCVLTETLGQIARPDLEAGDLAALALKTSWIGFAPFLPLLLGMSAAALAVNFGQVGFHLSAEPFKPDLNRINPVSGAKRLFSLRSVAMLIVSSLKVAAICAIGYLSISSFLGEVVNLNAATPEAMISVVSRATLDLGLKTALLLAVIAVIDYAYQRWQFERDLRMSKQDVKDDHKLTEGDPGVKSRIRRVQILMTRRRMLADVPKADVVVRNPTHYAVALQYNSEKSRGAPLVLAKGADLLAQKIIEIARKHDVPIVADPPVARTLYRAVEVGEEIPPKLYRAIARILAHIYSLRRKRWA